MKYRIRLKTTLSLLTFILVVAFPSTIRADNLVLGGFDLFETVSGTQVNLGPLGAIPPNQPFQGVPLLKFDFGMGEVDTFNTDTIVQRLGTATPESPTVPIRMEALQLMSMNQFNVGAGTGFLFVTLQSDRVGGGTDSTGTLTITFGPEVPEGESHGTFDSTLNVAFDIRFGALNGPIIFSDTLTLTADDIPWSHFPPPFTVLIDGINFKLNTDNQFNDFFPDPFVEAKPQGAAHSVRSATTPEPTTLFLLGAGLAGVAAKLRKRGKAELKD